MTENQHYESMLEELRRDQAMKDQQRLCAIWMLDSSIQTEQERVREELRRAGMVVN